MITATRLAHQPASPYAPGPGRGARPPGRHALAQALGVAATGWADQAACGPDSDVPAELFWPGGEGDPRALVARVHCAGCPVRQECLDFAEATRQPLEYTGGGGVWGGLTSAQRKQARAGGWRPGDRVPSLAAFSEAELVKMLGSEWAGWLPPELVGVLARRWQHAHRRAG